jgi:hypothetical protein
VRSRSNACLLGAALFLVTLAVPPAAAQDQRPAEISREEIEASIAFVMSDPNLGSERKMNMLRWRDTGQRSRKPPGWMSWIAGFFGWTMQSARYLMWAGLVFLAAWLAVYLTRAFRNREKAGEASEAFVAPTHVRNLDIRPESLPPNIGKAARALWDRGEHRAALSLLYRGLLSRLAHVHRVPIKDSTTEGDCLLLLPGRVPPPTSDYSARLVDAWGGFVYGGTEAPATAIHELCDGFAGALDRAMPKPIREGAE